jgi:phosphoribosylformimino-5-aminoimidazole carboxamide ribotide isomerase
LKIYPTLNLQHGRVVSTAGQESVCSLAPLELVARLLEEGVNRLALVDVDAARSQGHNRELIAQILQRCNARDRKVCVQVAGGIRSSDQAQFFLDQGARWLVAGTILHKSQVASDQLMARFQSSLVAAVDAQGGRVHRSGWVDSTPLSAIDLALRAKDYGFKRLLFVDIPETAHGGPDFATARLLVEATNLPLIMGGSLVSPDHLEAAQGTRVLRATLVDALLFESQPRLMAFLQAACA